MRFSKPACNQMLLVKLVLVSSLYFFFFLDLLDLENKKMRYRNLM